MLKGIFIQERDIIIGLYRNVNDFRKRYKWNTIYLHKAESQKNENIMLQL